MKKLDYDQFVIGECVGTGTVGAVYSVIDKETGKTYALKLLSPGVGSDGLIVSRFEREIEILSKLNHPNVVAFVGYGRHERQLFYVMEYLNSGTLADVLRNSGPLSWPEAAECGRQLAIALQHLHNNGVIHRDVKPGNVYLTDDGRLKLGDFGIARDTQAMRLTDTGLTVGTYAYMSPELVRGESAVTGKSDLYSLGCLLFEILVGKPPYPGSNFVEITEQHLNAPPPSVRAAGIACPATFDKLIQSLLAKDPEARPFNARAVQGVLGELTSDAYQPRPGEAPSPTDRGAASVMTAQAMFARRIAKSRTNPEVSWLALGLIAGGITVLLAVAAWLNA
ncbi:MAG: serine/threonine protein kinase [Planctomycetales bacterium]|nr:serine/threonine protein kinase [Planctomycetales bacterium]